MATGTEVFVRKDVFLSYAREDFELARAVVNALERLELSVSWDREIAPGENWRKRLERMVGEARFVLVLWTRNSVVSHWVEEEASFAREKGSLICARLDDVEIPFGFRSIQTADLRIWNASEDDLALRELAARLHMHLGTNATARLPMQRRISLRKLRSKRFSSMASLVLPTLLVIFLNLALRAWPAPTQVEVEAVVSSLRFHVVGQEQQMLLGRISARKLAIRGFKEASLTPADTWIADPTKYHIDRDIQNAYPVDAWKRLAISGSLTLRPTGSAEAAITAWPLDSASEYLGLDNIFVGPADVTLESPDPGKISIRLRGQRIKGAVSLPKTFLLVADHCLRVDPPLTYGADSVTLKIQLKTFRLLGFSSDSGLLVAIEYPSDYPEPVLGQEGLALDRVQFLRQGPLGKLQSTIAGPGAIHYSHYPAVPPVQFGKADFLILDDLI